MTSPNDFDDEAETLLAPRLGGPKTSGASFALTVIAGPDKGATITLSPGAPTRSFAGQSPSCELRLTDRTASRRHAAFEPAGPRLRVIDLGSKNGTLINDVAITDAFVHGGEVVKLGETSVRVDLAGEVAEVSLPPAGRFGKLVGASAEMRALYPLCDKLAASSVPVLIEGETGTGKEVLAESLHEKGPRAGGPFVVFDCTAVPPSLLESALFGHERGSFTGATETRRGVFEEAHNGTLLLDEIGDLELPLQAKLLRALERSEVQRVGSNRWNKVDVRVLAATRRDLDRAIQEGRFRDDLYFRLAVARIELPPLRRRTGDVRVLAHHFWRQLAQKGERFPAGFGERLDDYSWPGNVRELFNAVARRVALGDLAPIETARAAAGGGDAPPPSSRIDFLDRVLALDLPLTKAREEIVGEFERRYVQRVLERHGGNVSAAAAASGLARRYFQLLRARQKG